MSDSYLANHTGKISQYFWRGAAVSAADENGHPYSVLLKQLCDIGYFVRALRIRARFGRLSRAPLRLLRLEFREADAQCDWMARPPDAWDADFPRPVGERNASIQAIEDAMAVRELLFCALPGAETAVLRAFRQSAAGEPELIITGTVTRVQQATGRISSLVMRAKLHGFQFCLDDGILEALRTEEHAMSF
jgi:hypothetical protein